MCDALLTMFSTVPCERFNSGSALAANLFGAMLGGFLEYNSMYLGFSSLYPLGMVLYGLAWVLVFTIVLIPIAWLMFGVVSIWFLYRVVRGWLALNDRRPMPV